MKDYESPQLEIIEVEVEGVICTSGDTNRIERNGIEGVSYY